MAILTSRRSGRPIALHVAILLGVALILVLSSRAERADAVVTTVGSGSEAVSVGLQPRNGTSVYEANTGTAQSFENAAASPVMHSTNTYAIYWDPTDHYHGDWQNLIDVFLQGVGLESGSLKNVFSVDTQYTDQANHPAPYSSTFRGAYTDTDKYPSAGCDDPEPMQPEDRITCLTDHQIRLELQEFIAQHGLQKGMSTIFYMLTPPGVTVCLDKGGMTGHCSDSEAEPSVSYSNSFCSYHSDIGPANPATEEGNTVIYAVVPWVAGGEGDYHLNFLDRTEAYQCQDGGFNPAGEPIETREKPKEKTTKEEEEFKEKTLEEQIKQQEEEALEGPHEQEPNQVSGRSPDGTFDTGLADIIITQMASEQQNATTDPLLDGWQDKSHLEDTDECRNFFANGASGGGVAGNLRTGAGSLFNQVIDAHNYYLNDAFNLAALHLPYPAVPCIGGLDLLPEFTAPSPVNAGDLVGFNGMESDITLNVGTFFPALGSSKPIYATYLWNFGDGTPEVSGYAPGAATSNPPEVSSCAEPWETPCAASVFHSYQYGGIYTVTLTVTDVGGDVARVTHQIAVDGPAPPSPPARPGGSGSGTGTSAGSSAAAAATPAAPATTGNSAGAPSASTTLPSPVLTAVVPSKGLKTATHKGLAVSYTVNEQVAGSLQVLLESSKAKRLGITGPTATGLPAGTPRSIVIGTAVLVTTKAGKGTIHIKFSSRTAKRLGAMHKVKLTLRLVARNASRQNPRSTTLLSTVVLNG